jgi:5-methylcytosine-specific restriction enzyme subunit McrC
VTAVAWLPEWRTMGPGEEPCLRGRQLSAEAGAAAARLTQSGFLEVRELRDGLELRAQSHVGTLTLDDLTIHVQPKIGPELLPTFMRYALGLSAVRRHPSAEMPLQRPSFLDLVALMLQEEVERIFHSGLFQDYRSTDAWLAMPRGKLLFSELARQPHRMRLEAPCRYSRRTADVPLNRLMLAALGALRPRVGDAGLRFELHRQESLLTELCEPLPLTGDLLTAARESTDRRTSYYAGITRLAALILSARGPSVTEGEREQLPGFLFDMDRMFESFVARLFAEFAPAAIRVQAQQSSREAYRYRSNPHGWQLPQLRPDMIVRGPDERPILVLDTKYKLLSGQRPSSEDLYQLTLYSLSFGRGRSVPARIVYPRLGPGGPEPVLDFYGCGAAGLLATVSLSPLDLTRCAEALTCGDRPALQRMVAAILEPPG